MGLLDEIRSGYNYVNDHLGATMNSPLFTLGMGMLNGGTGLNNVGNGIMQAQTQRLQNIGQQQNNQMGALQMEMLRQQWPAFQGLLSQLQGPQGAPQGAPQGGLMAAGPQPSGAVTSPMPGAPGPDAGAPPTAGTQPGGLLGEPSPQPQQNPADAARASIMRQFNQGIAFSMLPMTKDAGAGLIKKAEFMAQYDPALAQQMEMVKSTIGQDQALLAQAQAGGDPLMIKGAQMKLMKDLGLVSVANNNGAVTTFGGVTPQILGMNGVNPAQGIQVVGGQESPIPGAPQTEAALAGAKAGAESGAEYAPVYDANGQQIGFAPRASILSQPRAGAPAAAPAAPPTSGGASRGSVSFGLGPAQQAMLHEQATQAGTNNKEYQDQAENANNMITQVETLKADAANFTPGPRADERAFALRALYSAGLITDKQQQELGAYESGQKVAIQLQAAATKALGSREAAQIFGIMGKSLPNLSLSKVGLQNVASYQEGIARYQQARASWANERFGQSDYQGVNSARDTWIKNSNPLYYILASAPPEVATEMMKSMGKKAPKFAQDWTTAIQGGYAPRPSEYGNAAGP